MRILIVDDELISRQKLKILLEKKGRCDTAVDGLQAFKMFCDAFLSKERYKLVTLDYNMPGLTGPELLRMIRDFEATQGVVSRDQWTKVVMVTAQKDTSSVMNSYKSGCEDYLIKPFNQDDISKCLSQLGLAT